MIPVARVCYRQRPMTYRPTPITVRRSLPAMNIDVTYLTGKTIILFTMFFSSLRWAYYQHLRKKIEEEEDYTK